MIIHKLYEGYGGPEASKLKADQAMRWLDEHGSDWIDQAGGSKVWRAVQAVGKDLEFSIRPVRKDRRPRDTSIELTRAANQSIAAAGKTANRTNSVFVYPTNAKSQCGGYGFVHVAVPSNGFKYTWSPGIVDLFGDIIEPREDDEKKCAEMIRDLIWLGDDNTLQQALHSECEIMIACEQVALFEPVFWERFIVPELRNRE